jgi:hypothetical protein
VDDTELRAAMGRVRQTLTDAGQLVRGWKQDVEGAAGWTEWDQSVLDRISKALDPDLRLILAAAEIRCSRIGGPDEIIMVGNCRCDRCESARAWLTANKELKRTQVEALAQSEARAEQMENDAVNSGIAAYNAEAKLKAWRAMANRLAPGERPTVADIIAGNALAADPPKEGT